jgi:hypothetical protein
MPNGGGGTPISTLASPNATYNARTYLQGNQMEGES